MVAAKDHKRIHATEGPAADVLTRNVRGVVHDVWKVDGNDAAAVVRVEVRSQHWSQHVSNAGSLRRFIESCFVALLDDSLELAGRSPSGLHRGCIKEYPHLRLGARLIEGNRVENIASVFRSRPRSPERIIAGSLNEGV